MTEQQFSNKDILLQAGAQVIEAARGLTGYDFKSNYGGHWAATVVSYDLRLADLLEEALRATQLDLRWSCQLLLRSIADTWLHGRYLITGEGALDRMMHAWNVHLWRIQKANDPDPDLGEHPKGEMPPKAYKIAEMLDEKEPPYNPVLAAQRVYASVWKTHSDWAAHGGLSTVAHYKITGDDDYFGLQPTVASDFNTITTATVGAQLVADFTRRTFRALQVEIPEDVAGLLDALCAPNGSGTASPS